MNRGEIDNIRTKRKVTSKQKVFSIENRANMTQEELLDNIRDKIQQILKK